MFIFLPIPSRALAHNDHKLNLQGTLSFPQITQNNTTDSASAVRALPVPIRAGARAASPVFPLGQSEHPQANPEGWDGALSKLPAPFQPGALRLQRWQRGRSFIRPQALAAFIRGSLRRAAQSRLCCSPSSSTQPRDCQEAARRMLPQELLSLLTLFCVFRASGSVADEDDDYELMYVNLDNEIEGPAPGTEEGQ